MNKPLSPIVCTVGLSWTRHLDHLINPALCLRGILAVDFSTTIIRLGIRTILGSAKVSRKAVANWRRKYDEDNRVAEVRSPMEKGWGFCSEARIDYCATFDTWPMTVMKKKPRGDKLRRPRVGRED